MSTVEITRVEDVRAGDVVTMTDKHGGTYTGPTRHSETLGAVFGPLGWAVNHPLWTDHPAWTFVRATREVPDLPTEPGSVIVNATIRGVEGQTAIRLGDINWVGTRTWVTTTRVEDYWYHAPEDITAWEPGRIVPEGQS